ncbi:hypothetical protein MLD38_032278 [Melastoma candidum]|uniref:Uncharacterized protein n=1 Tax=Melastoma candidum TaxID=119954 RepID=A0ACB9M3A8_9MYRT|nr:hypothetical protein MLD38_032278 [Melastoma candidum]
MHCCYYNSFGDAKGSGFENGGDGSRGHTFGGGGSRDYPSPGPPPDPIPDRPLRQQQPGRMMRSGRSDFSGEGRRNDLSDDGFLEKFKLSFDRKDKSESQANAATGKTSREEDKGNREDRGNERQQSVPEEADAIFKKMKETGLIPNAVAMLDGLCKDGLVSEAMDLFRLMREKGSIPEVVIYTAVVEGFCKAHKFDDAKRIFRKMQTNGISPNAFSYTVLIQGLYKCERLEESVEFCEEMLEAGHSPNVATFVGLVDVACREKDVEEVRALIKRLGQKGFCIDEKAVRDFLEKKAPFNSPVWEAIFGKKPSHKLF